MNNSENQSVFHEGERAVQSRLGVRNTAEIQGKRFVRNYLTDQHRKFYQGLAFIFVSSVDESGQPWASILYGRPGFLSTPSDSTLRVQARPLLNDPLNANLQVGKRLGFLGIEYTTRRRNRMTGRVSEIGNGYFVITVDQSFGNCPQYIHSRQAQFVPESKSSISSGKPESLEYLTERAQEIVSKADNFYIATYCGKNNADRRHGSDVSHRGGPPGFVAVVDRQTLKFPDFAGNNHFNTLGNIELNPVAGLLFIDFDNSDLLYLTGTATVKWDGPELSQFKGAQSILEFSIIKGRVLPAALPICWSFDSFSPSLADIGSWTTSTNSSHRIGLTQRHREYRVFKIVDESQAIRSFYLEPLNGAGLPAHEAGQHLPIELSLPGHPFPSKRTYTISNAPNGSYLRLSIKREEGDGDNASPGIVSNFFHNSIDVGHTIRATDPQGEFVLEPRSNRPIVLISAGVGITPMIAFLDERLRNAGNNGNDQTIWFIHGNRNSAQHGFREYLQRQAKRHPWLRLYTLYSRPLPSDQEGEHFDATGHVNATVLKTLLPLDDYEFYYCGPKPFMASMNQALRSLGTRKERVHYEYFGSPATRSVPDDSGNDDEAMRSIQVEFRLSGIEAHWTPSLGSLLEFAEHEGLSPPYSCRSGSCHTCLTPIVSGEIEYAQEPASGHPDDGVLICCAIPRLPVAGSSTSRLVLDL